MATQYRIIPTLTPQQITAFNNKIHRTADGSNCHEWTGSINDRNYGRFNIGRATYLAHRIAYTLHYGQDPADLMVCHRCDNPKCCNPFHLFLGTNTDNHTDCVEKGRHVRGQAVHTSYLSENDVLEIRRLYSSGQYTYQNLADRFQTTHSNIATILDGRSWKHLPVFSKPPASTHAPKGEHAGNSKLTEQKVREIRRLRATGLPLAKIAQKMNVHLGTIFQIVNGKTWKHVD